MHAVRPVDPEQSFPELEEAGARALARARRLPRVAAPPRGAPSRGSSTRARRPPTAAPARTTSSPASSRTSSRASRRCAATTSSARAAGTATACRSRSRSSRSSGIKSKDEIEAYGIAEFNRAVPRVGLRVPRGLERADRAHRLLARPRRRLPHARPDLHRVGLVGAAPDLRQGPALRGPQGRPLLPALRHGAVLPRGRAGLPGRRRPVASTCASRSPRTAGRCRPATSCSCGRRRRGRSSPTRRSPSTPSSRTCARRPAPLRRRSCSPRRSSSACSARSAQVLDRFPGAALDGVRYEPPFPLHRRPRVRRARATPSCSATSSPPTTAPASCTPRSPSARTTSASASSTG